MNTDFIHVPDITAGNLQEEIKARNTIAEMEELFAKVYREIERFPVTWLAALRKEPKSAINDLLISKAKREILKG